jgi:hypothetical protein
MYRIKTEPVWRTEACQRVYLRGMWSYMHGVGCFFHYNRKKRFCQQPVFGSLQKENRRFLLKTGGFGFIAA